MRACRSLRSFRSLSTKVKISQVQDGVPEEVQDGSPRPPAPAPTPKDEARSLKPSFARELFVGRFDTSVLTFPEALDKGRYDTLHEMLGPIERFFNTKVDSKQIDEEGKIPEGVLEGLKELGLYGQQIPVEYGGLGLNSTEYARIAEATAMDGSIGVTLAAHQAIGLKALLLYGTENQKQKYLPKLASGEWTAAFALTEACCGSDAGGVKTKATLSADGSTWFLTGSKIWISNGGTADFYTVFALTADECVTTQSTNRITAFAVEKGFGGITLGKPEDKLGIRGSNTCEVHFEGTPVPMENVIGEIGDGFKIAVNVLNSGRFSMGSAGAGMLKNLTNAATEHAIHRKQFGKPLAEFELVREKIARMTIDTYIMESLAYLTAGMIDSGEFEDCAVESAIVKVFSSEACWKGANECIQIFGGMGYMKNNPYERILRDSRIMPIFEGTNEILRMFIALMGLEHAGQNLREVVKKIRSPFMFPGYAMKRAFQKWRINKVRTFQYELHGFLHPTLKKEAEDLETSLMKFESAVEMVLCKYGANVADHQLMLKRLADIAIDMYCMTAVLSRASRSYCIGLRNSFGEIHIAQIICHEYAERIQKRFNEIDDGDFLTTDYKLMKLSEFVFEKKGYFLDHPLNRTFW